jgi:hypothetical protein
MDIDAKRELKQDDNATKLLATREQIFKALIADNSKIIDAEIVN